jgi:hypothetical protein
MVKERYTGFQLHRVNDSCGLNTDDIDNALTANVSNVSLYTILSGSNISKNEIPILTTLIDRNDQIYAFRDAPSEQELEHHANQKTKLRKRRPHNYNFLRKLLVYARTINPEMTVDTEDRLNKFWINARPQIGL